MGNIYVTSDTHGLRDIAKIEYLKNMKCLTQDDFLIIGGDFGMIWNNEEDGLIELALKDFYESLGCTVLWVDGNHENHARLNAMPVTFWHGGKVHQISEHVFHLMRGQVFEICGKKFFTMGGAASTDKQWRTQGISWWKQEVPNKKERKEAKKNLKKAKWRVDFVVSHTAPSKILAKIGANYRIDEYTNWLEEIANKLKFSTWYFGHFHDDMCIEKGKYILCFDEVNMIFGEEEADA